MLSLELHDTTLVSSMNGKSTCNSSRLTSSPPSTGWHLKHDQWMNDIIWYQLHCCIVISFTVTLLSSSEWMIIAKTMMTLTTKPESTMGDDSPALRNRAVNIIIIIVNIIIIIIILIVVIINTITRPKQLAFSLLICGSCYKKSHQPQQP